MKITIKELLNLVEEGKSFSVYGFKGYTYLNITIIGNKYTYRYTDDEDFTILKEFDDYNLLYYTCLNLFNDIQFNKSTLDVWE